MIPTFNEWMKFMDEQQSNEIPKGGWSKRTAVPVGTAKDTHPDHPENAVDPEPNPGKHRGKIHIPTITHRVIQRTRLIRTRGRRVRRNEPA
jgi:hypothetical protein